MGVLDLAGRGALVVGGGQGMGRATALLLARAGADVVVLDMDRARAGAVAAEVEALGRRSAALSADVTDAAAATEAIAGAERALGGLDVVVDIVGGASWASLLDVDEATWERDFAVNLKQHLFVGRAAARNWIDHERAGVLCVVASVSGLFSSARHGAYGAAKAGVLSFVRTAAEEWWPHGIRVNAVVPGAVRTPRMEAEWAAGSTPRPADELLDRMAMPEDIAGAIAYFVSDLSRKVTGQSIVVDGGWTTRFPYRLTP
ncbi:MAG: SDR family oxidoreductase [Spirochaetaceae bacterium]|nr:SDR family oxidoreductase [Spirochaetaceae bacterium]